jgi:hypothetical protein
LCKEEQIEQYRLAGIGTRLCLESFVDDPDTFPSAGVLDKAVWSSFMLRIMIHKVGGVIPEIGDKTEAA